MSKTADLYSSIVTSAVLYFQAIKLPQQSPKGVKNKRNKSPVVNIDSDDDDSDMEEDGDIEGISNIISITPEKELKKMLIEITKRTRKTRTGPILGTRNEHKN